MVDLFALGLTHVLLAIAALRLLARADLDRDPPAPDRCDEAGRAAQADAANTARRKPRG